MASCKQCQDHLPSLTKEPIVLKPKPARPFQELAVDFCSHAGHSFLVLVDCFTDWPDIVHLGHDATTPSLLAALRQAFCRSGAPDVIWSDQGPQFMSKLFQDFSREWGFRHATSSPTYPQSNGKAEAAVKSMKKIIRAAWTGTRLDSGRMTRGLLQYRNTPSRKDGLSPAQKLFGRPIQDVLPAHHRAFAPEWQRSAAEADEREQAHRDLVESHYNCHAHTLPDIHVGSNVAVQDASTKRWDIYGVVTDIGPHRRYFVKTGSGRVLVRNRRFLRRRVPCIPSSQPCSSNPQSSTPPALPLPMPQPIAPVPPPLRRSTRQRIRTPRRSTLVETFPCPT